MLTISANLHPLNNNCILFVDSGAASCTGHIKNWYIKVFRSSISDSNDRAQQKEFSVSRPLIEQSLGDLGQYFLQAKPSAPAAASAFTLWPLAASFDTYISNGSPRASAHTWEALFYRARARAAAAGNAVTRAASLSRAIAFAVLTRVLQGGHSPTRAIPPPPSSPIRPPRAACGHYRLSLLPFVDIYRRLRAFGFFRAFSFYSPRLFLSSRTMCIRGVTKDFCWMVAACLFLCLSCCSGSLNGLGMGLGCCFWLCWVRGWFR